MKWKFDYYIEKHWRQNFAVMIFLHNGSKTANAVVNSKDWGWHFCHIFANGQASAHFIKLGLSRPLTLEMLYVLDKENWRKMFEIVRNCLKMWIMKIIRNDGGIILDFFLSKICDIQNMDCKPKCWNYENESIKKLKNIIVVYQWLFIIFALKFHRGDICI